MRIVKSDEEGLEAAAKVLLAGGVAVIPTDTVYGLAAHPDFPQAVDRLYTIKGREAKKPIALLAADVEAVERFGFRITDKALELVKHWPGSRRLSRSRPRLDAAASCEVRRAFARDERESLGAEGCDRRAAGACRCRAFRRHRSRRRHKPRRSTVDSRQGRPRGGDRSFAPWRRRNLI